MKRSNAITTIFIMIFMACSIHAAYGAPYLDANSPGGLHFKLAGNTVQMTFDIKDTRVDAASGGKSDPLIGQYLTIFTPNTNYDYTLGKQISDGVWTTSKEAATIIVQSQSANPTKYLETSAIAQTIDFNTGTISWSSLTPLSTYNIDSLGSSTLKEFSNYSTGQLSFSFETSDALRAFISDPSKLTSMSVGYSANLSGVTGTPEPPAAALLAAGLALIGLFMYRRRGTAASPFLGSNRTA